MADAIKREERDETVAWAQAHVTNTNVVYAGHASSILAYEAALRASEAEVERLRKALDERDLFINPHLLEQAADEIDCGASCENIWRAGCGLSEKGGYCPNDVAETLRAVAKVARAALTGEKP